MSGILRIVLGLVACAASGSAGWGSAAWANDPPAASQQTKPKVEVELRWVEPKRVEGLTEEEGFQCSCDPDDIVYPHKEPALVLTRDEVAEVRVKNHDFSRNGLSASNHMVSLHLTQAARDKLAASFEGDEMRLLTVVVDGKYWGVHRYEKNKDKPFVPAQARAESFVPDVGFFSSQGEAQRLADAFK